MLDSALLAGSSVEPGAFTPTGDLYLAFTAWWETTHARHERPPNRFRFGRRLGERDELREDREGHDRTRGWRGVCLLPGALAPTPPAGNLPFPDVEDADGDRLPF